MPEDILIDYIPETENDFDDTRNDQEIWNLVGLNPLLLVLRNVTEEFFAWARTQEEQDMAEKLQEAVLIYERGCYDRYAKPYYRPSVEYSFHCKD